MPCDAISFTVKSLCSLRRAPGSLARLRSRGVALPRRRWTDLLTRFPFDESRHFIREHPAVAGKTMPPLRWLAHGPYLIEGRDEPLEIFEVGADGLAPLVAPADSEKAKRAIRPGEEETLGWRPAVGLEIPGRTGWHLTERLGAGGFGEVWVGEHAKLHQRRAFKFCFDDERLRALKREVTLVRLLAALGERETLFKSTAQARDPPSIRERPRPARNLYSGLKARPWFKSRSRAHRPRRPHRHSLAAAHRIESAQGHQTTNIRIFDGPGGEPPPTPRRFRHRHPADHPVGELGVTGAASLAPPSASPATPYSRPKSRRKPLHIQGTYGLGVMLYQLYSQALARSPRVLRARCTQPDPA